MNHLLVRVLGAVWLLGLTLGGTAAVLLAGAAA